MSDGIPVNFYLDLETGRTADLEVVARTAISWSEAVKEIAYIMDPSMEVRLDLFSGTPSSLSLNTFLRAISKTKQDHKNLVAIAVGAATWLAMQAGGWTVNTILDYLTGKDAPPIVKNLTSEEIEEIAARIHQRIQPQTIPEKRSEIFIEAERDTAIKGVGVGLTIGQRPSLIIPRTEFIMGPILIESVDHQTQRTSNDRLKVTLISPILKAAERTWRFQYGTLPEFGAKMKDDAFLNALADGKISIPLKAGVEMEINLSTKEVFDGDVWIVKERTVTRVYSPAIDRSGELPF